MGLEITSSKMQTDNGGLSVPTGMYAQIDIETQTRPDGLGSKEIVVIVNIQYYVSEQKFLDGEKTLRNVLTLDQGTKNDFPTTFDFILTSAQVPSFEITVLEAMVKTMLESIPGVDSVSVV